MISVLSYSVLLWLKSGKKLINWVSVGFLRP